MITLIYISLIISILLILEDCVFSAKLTSHPLTAAQLHLEAYCVDCKTCNIDCPANASRKLNGVTS